MSENIKKQFKEALKDQQMIFGDDLLLTIDIPKFKNAVIPKPATIVQVDEIISKDEKVISVETRNELFHSAKTIDELEGFINKCKKCTLGNSRKSFVFGAGNPNADILIIGEAPGADEDEQGKPFVGRAGKLLTDILKAIKFEREDVFIANILKCRPPNNRKPLPLEMETCFPYLRKQIELVKPKAILLLGLTAAKGILELNLSLTKMRGKVYEFEGIKTMVTFHPAALLRNPSWKRGCWEDVQAFKKLYEDILG